MRPERSIHAANVHPVVARLTELRLAWGLSVEQIAVRVGCSYFTIAQAETGQRQIGLKVLAKWASVLGYDLSLRPQQLNGNQP